MAKMPATDKTATDSRLPFAIVWAAVVVAALGFALWSRSAKQTAATSTPSPVQAMPTPTIAASPTVPIPPSPTPSPATVTPTPSPPEGTATAEPKTSAASTPQNQKAPSPRNNRAWQVWIDEFVHNFIASNEVNDLDLAASFYAPNVDLFEEGRKTDLTQSGKISSHTMRAGRRAARRFAVTCGSAKKQPTAITPRASSTIITSKMPVAANGLNGRRGCQDLQITIESDRNALGSFR